MKNLADELNQKQALKFQLNGLNPSFIEDTLTKNDEGIFYLSSAIGRNSQETILLYLGVHYKNFNFELERGIINPVIYFKKR